MSDISAPLVRVSQMGMNRTVGNNLEASLDKLQNLQEQLSSGKAINKPSDDPTGTVAALRFRADLRRSTQLKSNAEDATSWLNTADATLNNSMNLLNRVRSLAVGAVNGSIGPAELDASATELAQIRDQLMSNANTTYLGRPIFAGTGNTTAAYNISGAYQGDTGAVNRMVAPNVSVPVNLNGPQVYGADGSNLFDVLGQMVNDMRSNNTAALATDQTNLDTAYNRMNTALATVGARTNQVTSMANQVDQSVIDSTNGLSQVEDVDLPKTVVQLQMQQVAYQAALSATAKVIQPSLVDFLR